MHTALTAAGEAMPKTLTEALALDAHLAATHDVDDEAAVERYLENWEAIHSGRFPIRSPQEATALLRKMEAELEHSRGDFIDGILEQLNGFIAALAGTKASEIAV
ncbi:hypothetical protein [Rhizobium hainanense]|uniref:Uncharacterized protein n=1 Tax=Rhizobium hainanense TaxID=52131 RepID=A0A1C3UMP4_9HYPH|nr:hypothetical protein [Rhizobium hainanense]SCB16607.1 hypothetical protein GA0061100_102645 [Rhizobium hainanense]